MSSSSNCACPGEPRSWTGTYMSKVGGWAGDELAGMGTSAAKRFKNWSGLGDYKVVANSLIQGHIGGGATNAIITRPERGMTVIRHREYVGEIKNHPTIAGELFVQKFEINPANKNTFPWLSGIAKNWDRWKPLGIIFEFQSTVSSNASDSSLGSILTTTDYDVLDAVPTSKQAILNSSYSTQTRMDQHMIHGIECDPSLLQRTVFYTGEPKDDILKTAQIRDYNMGNFFIATAGGNITPNTAVGELYCHFEIGLLDEQTSTTEDPLFGYFCGLLPSGEGDGGRYWDNWDTIAPVDTSPTFSEYVIRGKSKLSFSPATVGRVFKIDICYALEGRALENGPLRIMKTDKAEPYGTDREMVGMQLVEFPTVLGDGDPMGRKVMLAGGRGNWKVQMPVGDISAVGGDNCGARMISFLVRITGVTGPGGGTQWPYLRMNLNKWPCTEPTQDGARCALWIQSVDTKFGV